MRLILQLLNAAPEAEAENAATPAGSGAAGEAAVDVRPSRRTLTRPSDSSSPQPAILLLFFFTM